MSSSTPLPDYLAVTERVRGRQVPGEELCRRDRNLVTLTRQFDKYLGHHAILAIRDGQLRTEISSVFALPNGER